MVVVCWRERGGGSCRGLGCCLCRCGRLVGVSEVEVEVGVVDRGNGEFVEFDIVD